MRDFVSEPHTAIVGKPQDEILNLVDARAAKAQDALLLMAKETVAKALNDVRKLVMPMHDDVRAKDVDLKRLGAVLAVAHEQDVRDFASLFLLEGLRPRTLQSLALVAEVVHGAPRPVLRSGALLLWSRRFGELEFVIREMKTRLNRKLQSVVADRSSCGPR